MQKRSIPLAGALLLLSALSLSAQQQKDWRQQPLEYQHSVTLELTTGISASGDGTPIIAHPIVRRLSSIANVADLRIAGTLTGGTITVRFGFRNVQAFDEWNNSPATRELMAELEKLGPTGVMVSLAMNPRAIEK